MLNHIQCISFCAALIICGSTQAVDSVQAVLETPARIDEYEGNKNDADDPAIWPNPKDASKSLVIATLKKGGMDVYNLKGEVIQHITPKPIPKITTNPARLNNVDIAFGVEVLDKKVDLAIATDRQNDMIRIFRISEHRLRKGRDPLVEITAQHQSTIFNNDPVAVANGDFTAYGLAAAQPIDGKTFVFVSQNDGNAIAKLELTIHNRGRVGYNIVETFNLPETFTLKNGDIWSPAHDDDGVLSHVEGMVVDAVNGDVYFAQEKVGIWKASIEDTAEDLRLIDTVNGFGVPYTRTYDPAEEEYIIELLWSEDPGFGSDYLQEDVEGLTIYDAGNGEGYLLASSQGSNEFAVYDLKTNTYIDNFAVVGGTTTDAVEESDGSAVINFNLGGEFTSGLIVIQDGNNTPGLVNEGEPIDNSNFKFISWGSIADSMGLVINNPYLWETDQDD